MIVDSDAGVAEYLKLCSQFENRLHSRWRYLMIAAFVGPVCKILMQQFVWVEEEFRRGLLALGVFRLLVALFVILFSYAIGAVAWCLRASAVWISDFSTSSSLRIQPGHSDGCGGLEPVGRCCLKSAIPLLIGMVLCLIWSNSHHVPGFKSYPDSRFLSLIIPFSYWTMVALLGLTGALVFLPVQGLHVRMESFKLALESQFTRALEQQLRTMKEVLENGDAERVKLLSDRLRIVQSSDPTALRLSTWPFDRTSLVKYGITPVVTLLGSFGKELVKALLQ